MTTKRTPTQVPSGGTRYDPCHPWGQVHKWLDGSVLQEGVGDFQTPECIKRMGPRKVVKREDLPRQYTLLKRLRVGTGCYRSSMKRSGMIDSKACQWDEPEQTAEHKSSWRPACSKAGQRRGGGMAARHRVDQRWYSKEDSFRCGPVDHVFSEANNNRTRKA